MDANEQLLKLCADFVDLQNSLLAAWRHANPGSSDLETLLDFPKHSSVRVNSTEWQASKHGVGVRFSSHGGVTVDVPFAVENSLAFDANRVFDYFGSVCHDEFSLLPTDRPAFWEMFDRATESGCIIPLASEAVNHRLFAIRSETSNLDSGCVR